MSKPRYTEWQRQYIRDWFANLHPNYRSELEQELGDALTAFQAWNLTFGEGAVPTPEKKPISTRTNLCFRSAPAQESQSESIAAPVEAVQGQDTHHDLCECAACIYKPGVQRTPTLEQFQRWLENKAHAAHAEYFNGPQGETLSQEVERCRPFTDFIARTRIATELLMQFKLEQGA